MTTKAADGQASSQTERDPRKQDQTPVEHVLVGIFRCEGSKTSNQSESHLASGKRSR
jgi:hypothetical protein